jgi:hypothetical protein
MRYLLGAMNEYEAVQFQNRLESESAIGDELIAQADLICQITSDEIALQDLPLTTSLASRNINARKWVQSLTAIAASLLLGFVLWSWSNDQSRQIAKHQQLEQLTALETLDNDGQSETDEELMIARAWADGPLSLALTSRVVGADIDQIDESDLELESLEPSEESVLNWMMVAVTEGANHEG